MLGRRYWRLLNPKSSPWILTHVCRRWRDLATSFPRLWTFIELDFDAHATHITPRQCAYKTGLYLGRSKDLSLSIDLRSKSSITNHAVFPILELSVPRWARLTIAIPERSLQSFSGNNFSRLHLLELQHVDEGQRNGKVTTFKSTPALQTLYACSSWEVLQKSPCSLGSTHQNDSSISRFSTKPSLNVFGKCPIFSVSG
ncbi:hypothetical protein BDZ89DRAFT_232764 [Hymenopellis radicata]|nr:hypothetical protein BDZ89DRAFT_232764 [Hymenopellis radicata]